MINKARKRNIRYHYLKKYIDPKSRKHKRMWLKAMWMSWGIK